MKKLMMIHHKKYWICALLARYRAGLIAIAVGIVFCAPSGAQAMISGAAYSSNIVEEVNPWRLMLLNDIAYLEKTINTHYIYAVYPGGPSWEAQLAASVKQVQAEARFVESFAGYRAVMKHFISSFQDAHLNARFYLTPTSYSWPGFLIRYQGGRYIVVESELPDVPVGSVISVCDGRTLDEWVDEIAEFEGGPKGLESTKDNIARLIFVDSKNPLYVRPKRCRICEKDVDLVWSDISAAKLDQLNQAHAPFLDESMSISEFGENGAWVRMGTFAPANARQAEQFYRIIQEAKDLRDKDVIILDVRGNPGGTYNWFMAFLREFYGPDYTDYYARARLEIRNIILNVSPTGKDDPGFPPEQNALKMPPDPPMEHVLDRATRVEKLPTGATLSFYPAPVDKHPKPAGPPPKCLVKARVYVLTDYGCRSACLSFLDEMMRFPGVKQIGVESFYDRRSGGWPQPFRFPSGLGGVHIGRMVRENRKRGENEPWKPTYTSDGDMADTAALKRWIREVVLKQDQEHIVTPNNVQSDAATDSERVAFAKSLLGEGRRITQHSVTIRGVTVDYKATVGGVTLLDSASRPAAILTYIGYTRRGISDAAHRPITFAWNGGPSAASTGLHLGVLGPRRQAVDESGHIILPAAMADNPHSILDRTDLLMVDPIGTGFSVPIGTATLKDFYSIERDAASVAQFIKRYLKENGRLESPVYILGESYGTIRNTVVANFLQSSGVKLAGIIFVASALDGNTIWETSGHLDPYFFYLPTYAAIAWYHHRLPQPPKDLQSLISEVERFALDEFVTTLLAWPKVTPAARASVLDKLHQYTGLSKEFWEKAGLRVGTVDFAQELLRDKSRIIMISDGRQSYPAPQPGSPRDSRRPGGGDSLMITYLRDELCVANSPEYRIFAPGADAWDWFDHGLRTRDPKIPGFQNFLDDLAAAMKANPQLRVQQHSGLFDLQCAPFPANWAMERMNIPEELRRNVQMFSYASGHAVFQNAPSEFLKFTANLAAFYEQAPASSRAR